MTVLRIAGGLGVMISFTVIANVLMKIGASTPLSERSVFGLVAWQSFIGIAAFGCAAIVYAWLLQWLPLNVMQSFAALQFVAVILASSVGLSEHIPMSRWFGVALITLGVVVVALTSKLPSEAPGLTGSNGSATAAVTRTSSK